MSRMIQREAAGAMLRRLIPGRVRVALFIYDDGPEGGKPGYRSVPDHGLIVNVRTLTEFRQLWKLVKGSIEGEGWKRDVGRAGVEPNAPGVRGAVADLGEAR